MPARFGTHLDIPKGRVAALAAMAARRNTAAALARMNDDPQTASRAWPGASPVALAAELEQLSLWPELVVDKGANDRDGIVKHFDPSCFVVRRIRQGVRQVLGSILENYHYEGCAGMNGHAFGLYFRRAGRDELVGVCSFARTGKPVWGGHTFRPTEADQKRLADGEFTERAFRNRLVSESEYQELNRLALMETTHTDAPLGTRAASWFAARCLQYWALRNNLLWHAITCEERGLVPAAPFEVVSAFLAIEEGIILEEHVPSWKSVAARVLRALQSEAKLDTPNQGTSFIKTVLSFADPAAGHAGTIYQALNFHYTGLSYRSEGKDSDRIAVGLRSGKRIGRRTLQKARGRYTRTGVIVRGHESAVLRMVWEGERATLTVRSPDGEVLFTDDLAHVRSLDATWNLMPTLGDYWNSLEKDLLDRFGRDVEFSLDWHEESGGIAYETFPAKHRYMTMLGARYWQHEVERRCKYLADRMQARDAAWHKKNWGPLPDNRSAFYPGRRTDTTATESGVVSSRAFRSRSRKGRAA